MALALALVKVAEPAKTMAAIANRKADINFLCGPFPMLRIFWPRLNKISPKLPTSVNGAKSCLLPPEQAPFATLLRCGELALI